MVLESANCTECRSEIWHNDNYCQECGVRTSFLLQRDTQWRKVPTGPSWGSGSGETAWQQPAEPSWKKSTESIWNQSVEPTPIRSFVQSTSVPSTAVPQPAPQPVSKVEPEPVTPPAPPPLPAASKPVAPPPPPLPDVKPTPVVKQDLAKEASAEADVAKSYTVKPEAKTAMSPPEGKPEPVSKPAFVPPVKPNVQPEAKAAMEPEPKTDDSVLKARWTALESPMLRPRATDEGQAKKPEEVVHKIKITNILWLCVCFLAGVLIYCLFDIVKMTILKPETMKQVPAVVMPAETKPAVPAPSKPVESNPPETQSTELSAPEEIPVPKASVPVKDVYVEPATESAPVKAAPKPAAKPAAVAKPAVKPVAKVAPAKPLVKPAVPVKAPVASKPKANPANTSKPAAYKPATSPEVVQPRPTAESADSSRSRTVWQAPSTTVKPVVTSAPKAKSPVVAGKGGGDLARYNRLLADYFSRAGNGSFGDESSEPPTYSEWLGRGKPEF